MVEVTLKNLTVETAAEIIRSVPDATSRRKSEWSIPVGECLVRFSVEGPTEKTDVELCQYAIDVLEVAKKHSQIKPASTPGLLKPLSE